MIEPTSSVVCGARGFLEQVKVSVHEVRPGRSIETFIQGLRYAVDTENSIETRYQFLGVLEVTLLNGSLLNGSLSSTHALTLKPGRGG